MSAIHVAGSSVGAAIVGGAGISHKGVVKELATTGVDHTTFLIALGAVLVVAGLLLLGLIRRHSVTGGS